MLNEHQTDYFDVHSGFKQWDTLSTTLFAIYINGLVEDIKALNKGVLINNLKVDILLYAEDIALLAENELDLQAMLDAVSDWCTRWRMSVNNDKT